MQENSNVFLFMVLVYNHEKYVIEHLESIKYLVEEFGSNYNVDLFINDDYSRDSSRELIQLWLSKNETLFRRVESFFNAENIGTCHSVINMLSHAPIDLAACKITAADDVYSCENIFEVCKQNGEYSMLSGLPLAFSEDELYISTSDYFGIIATDFIYKRKPLINRFKYLSVHNAPNMFYDPKFLMTDKTLSFLKLFDVVEDWPIQIAISEQNHGCPYILEPKIYVYYRRTQGSAYIVANQRFSNDKMKIYSYLANNSSGFIDKLLILNRRWLFSLGNARYNKFLNLCFYVFSFKCFLNFSNIFKFNKRVNVRSILGFHNQHLQLIRLRAKKFLES